MTSAKIGEAKIDEGIRSPDRAEPLLELSGVRAGYGSIEVLHGVDLILEPGAVVALLGPNGGGKTSTLKICSGVLPVTRGEFRLAGQVVNGVEPSELARLGVCSIPEGRGIFANLTVRENLWIATGTGVGLTELEEVAYGRFPILGERRGQLAGSMSGGEQQMLALSRALGTHPTVLLLDELSMGLAPRIVSQMYDVVGSLAAEGISILVAEQFARAVLPIATSAALMLQGRVVKTGDPHDIENELSTSYLGEMTMTTLAEDRREEFKKNIAELKLDKKQAGGDAATRIAGLVLMVVGVVGAFVVYISSLTLSDLRDLVSYQILTVVFLALTVVGAALFLAASVAKVLRLWLVRQLLEGQAQTDQISQALSTRN